MFSEKVAPPSSYKMRVVLKNRQVRLGDASFLTKAVGDYKRTYPKHKVYVDTAIPDLFKNNPYIEKGVCENPDKIYSLGTGAVTNGARSNGIHIVESMSLGLEEHLGSKLKKWKLAPEIYLDEYEKKNKAFDGRYWLICTDRGARFSTKLWIDKRWLEVVNKLSHINFVQIGEMQRNTVRLSGNNLTCHLGKTQNLRDLFSLIYNCEGIICLVSGPMHIAAAFGKPCVVIAGAREPSTLVQYQNHRFLHNIGCLPCAPILSPFCNEKEGCFKKTFKLASDEKKRSMIPEEKWGVDPTAYYREKKLNHIPKCMELITSDNVVDAINSYYVGGVLKREEKKIFIKIERPLVKIVTDGRGYGGAEMSVAWLIKMLQVENCDIEFIVRKNILCQEFRKNVKNVTHTSNITGECDLLILYCTDMIWDFHRPEFDAFKRLKAKKKVMITTFKLGRVGKAEWTKGWDKYMFLSSSMRDSFLHSCPDANTVVLPPMVDLSPFLAVKPDYSTSLNLARHSSQGDRKYHRNIVDIVKACGETMFFFMPAPSFMASALNIIKYHADGLLVEDFLAKANCFWYLLPDKYSDQGPRVIMEAMAAGLPVITERGKGGAEDRVDDSCGWFVRSEQETVDLINSLTPEMLAEKGKRAKEKAREWRPERWIEEIL